MGDQALPADAFLVLFNRLDLSAVTRLNRQQLIFMSAFLTLSAAILAAGFSRHFTKPILTIPAWPAMISTPAPISGAGTSWEIWPPPSAFWDKPCPGSTSCGKN